jgi:hypothetical protein
MVDEVMEPGKEWGLARAATVKTMNMDWAYARYKVRLLGNTVYLGVTPTQGASTATV